MKPVPFKEQNVVFAKDQKPYIPLPAHRGDNGQVISCWKPTLRERIAILFGCPLWLSSLTFNNPLQPMKLEVHRPFTVDHSMTGIRGFLHRNGLILGAILPEVEKLDALPEFQRAWYVEDPTTKKFKIDFSKVDVEDVAGLKATVTATRKEAAEAKAAREQAVRDALKPFDGIDPVKVKSMMDSLANEEERRLLSSGPEGIKKVIDGRMEMARADMAKQVQAAEEKEKAALEVASTFMERVLDNHLRAAAIEAGIHPGAVEDVLLRGRQIFQVSDEGDAVKFDEDGETVVMGKDTKTPYGPKEWLESMREKAPHWFPASGSGGGAQGSKGKGVKQDMTGLTPQQRLTMAREAQSR